MEHLFAAGDLKDDMSDDLWHKRCPHCYRDIAYSDIGNLKTVMEYHLAHCHVARLMREVEAESSLSWWQRRRRRKQRLNAMWDAHQLGSDPKEAGRSIWQRQHLT